MPFTYVQHVGMVPTLHVRSLGRKVADTGSVASHAGKPVGVEGEIYTQGTSSVCWSLTDGPAGGLNCPTVGVGIRSDTLISLDQAC